MAGIFTVSQVNSYIKNMFAQDFALSRISVRGEVSNCKYHSSGHIYFTLKDKTGTLAAVMFASQRKGLSFQLREGQQVVVSGSVDVYERDGRYQLYARSITLDGRGDLYEQFLRLKQELEDMGMFAPEYKQPIPRYATKIGVVTASTGAAIQDICNITARRNPYVQLILCPAQVQGEGAAATIVDGIRTLDKLGLDVIIVGRGGGSIEDLWAFNEESVARAIFDAQTPIISAVGHETDVTIADYVADLRAPTPSAAAELAVFDYRQFQEDCMSYAVSLNHAFGSRLDRARSKTEQYLLRLKVHDPTRQIRERRQRLADLEDMIKQAIARRQTEARQRLSLLAARLDADSPLRKISNGFGFVTGENGRRILSINEVAPGMDITVRIRDGSIKSTVSQTIPDIMTHAAEQEAEDNG